MYKRMEESENGTVVINAVSYTPIMGLKDEDPASEIPYLYIIMYEETFALVRVDREEQASLVPAWPPEILMMLFQFLQEKRDQPQSVEIGKAIAALGAPSSPPPPPYHLEGHDAFVAVVFHSGDKVRVDWNGMDKGRFISATFTYMQNLIWMDKDGRNAKLLHQMVDDIAEMHAKVIAKGEPIPSHMEPSADKPSEEKAPE